MDQEILNDIQKLTKNRFTCGLLTVIISHCRGGYYMKKLFISLQFIIMYAMVALNIVPLQAKAQEQYYATDLDDVISLGESSSSYLIGQEHSLYLMRVPSSQKIKISVEAECPDLNMTIDANWKLLQVNRITTDSIVRYDLNNTILNESMEMSEKGNYSFTGTMQLEKSYYLFMFENNTEELDLDISFSTQEIITYATSLTIPNKVTLRKGTNKTLKPTNILPHKAVAGITWSSNNSAIAKVNSKTGKVTGIQFGHTYINAKLKNGSIHRCKVYIENPQISKKSLVILKGNRAIIKVSMNYSKVYYSSSNKRVAMVTNKGKITAKGKGTTKITAKVGDRRLTCVVKVENPKMNQTKVSLTAGKSKKIRITGTTQKVTWYSSNTGVATVNFRGKVTTKKAGNATIYACVAGNTILSCHIVVKPAPKKIVKRNTSSATVYITEYGKKYHLRGCRYLWNSCIPISLNDAKAWGYDACSVCL